MNVENEENNDVNKPDQLNEPQVIYSGSKKITVSNSFEEAEETQIRYWPEVPPEQRFSDFHELMNRFYNFNKPGWKGKKIIIAHELYLT